MVKKVLMLYCQSQYEVLNIFTDNVKKALISKGIDVTIYDLRNAFSIETKDYSKHYDLIICFNSTWYNYFSKKLLLNENIPVWSFLVDSPIYHHGRLLCDNRFQFVSCIDRKHVEWIKKYYKNNNYCCFIPHGGIYLDNLIEWDKKEYDVSFFGTYNDPNSKLAPLDGMSDEIVDTIIEVVGKVYSSYTINFEEAFRNKLEEKGVILDDLTLLKITQNIVCVDQYIRLQRRHKVIETLISNGIHVHVYGNGWDNFKTDFSENLTIHGHIEHEEALVEMSKSRIVLNVMPIFPEGSHERIFNTMGVGSICFTDRSIYLEECFVDKEDLFFYSINDLQKLPHLINQVLNKEYDVDNIIKKSYKNMRENHTWSNRVEEILNYVESNTIENKELVKINNTIDYKFNNFMSYIKTISFENLLDKIKLKAEYYIETSPEYMANLKKSFITYPYWGSWNPENNDYGVIEERAYELKENTDKLIWLYNILADYKSKDILLNILLNWNTFDSEYLLKCSSKSEYRHYFDADIINIQDNEVFVDMGAYVGDTLSDFILESLNKYNKIYCYEFNKDSIKEIKKIQLEYDNIVLRNCAVGSSSGCCKSINDNNDSSSDRIIYDETGDIEIVSLDEDIKEKITFIKSDIEGAEYDALMGAKLHIQNDHPKLAISIYHGNKDIYRIAELIYSFDNSYKFYIRYYGGNLYPNEVVLYAV